MGSGSRNTGEYGVVTVETDFTEVIVDAELQECIGRGSNGPSVSAVMLYQRKSQASASSLNLRLW